MNYDPWRGVVSRNGIPGDELISGLQKSIRRGNADIAIDLEYEMYITSEQLEDKLWRRLMAISVEDIGFGTTITSKRKKRKTPLTIPRSQGSSQGTMMRSNSVLPVRLAMSITRRLKRQKAAMASTMPARPYPPKTPKNWSSS